MFFSDPEFDREVLFALLGGSVLMGAIVGAVRKNVWLGLLLVSILGNGSVVIMSDSAAMRGAGYFVYSYFSIFIWPILNIIFLVAYVLYARKKSITPKA